MKTTRLCLVLVTFTRHHPDLWTDVLAAPWICFIDVNLSKELGSGLNLSAIPILVLLPLLGYCRMAFVLLAVLLYVAPNFLSWGKQPGLAAPWQIQAMVRTDFSNCYIIYVILIVLIILLLSVLLL